MKVQKHKFLSLQNTDDNTPVLLIPFIVSFITAKTESISRSGNIQVLLTDNYFFHKRDDNSKQEKVGSVE